MSKGWINRIAAFSMVCLILFVVVKRYVFDQGKLNSNHRYTIAIVSKLSYPAEGGPIADFQYCINRVEYKGYASFDSKKQKVAVGEKFLLKYYPPNPEIARIQLDMPLNSQIDSTIQLDSCEIK